MSFGFPAYSTDSQRFKLRQSDLAGVVMKALGNLGWRYETRSPNKLIAWTSFSLWSWGEKIGIEVSYDGTVTAKSECLQVTQCFDWGKNRRNVRAFIDEATRIASDRDAPRDESLTPVERVIKAP
jgi:hypothetical protein